MDADTCAFVGAAAPTAVALTCLCPGVMLPRRADAVEVVGEVALVASAAGEGYRPSRLVWAVLRRPCAAVGMTV